ncbi:hypothetical protein BROUX41_005983 [Berkeleyomyces rouxiae]|uniref:uncharacterized protein n=1 Tax=Berkeleyomyces rouxiae TaxID=2035830 RepID=UPI003B7D8149
MADALNINQHVGLPQLVVVGDQSSGKSSLLESISGIPFPRNVELCTRYSTQISSRRDNTYKVNISIIPAPHSTPEHIEKLARFSPPTLSQGEFKESFPRILNEVNEAMGISMDEISIKGSVFSEDILKIEICGPDEDFLTIIDVPGIFRVAGGVTTPEDIILVKNIVTNYIRDKRTIILAVIPSNVDIATQEALSLAKEYDPNGERTLGILTKPDLVNEKSAQNAVCALVRGDKHQLALGYYLVRNRGADDQNSSVIPSTDSLDNFFKQNPWKKLPKQRLGVAALKSRLGVLLEELASREFPLLIRELKDNLKSAKTNLEQFGAPCNTPKEQLQLLGRAAKEIEFITRDALLANYNSRSEFQDSRLRLLSNLMNLSSSFRYTLLSLGHTWKMENFEQQIQGQLGEKPDSHQHDTSPVADSEDTKETNETTTVNNLVGDLIKRFRWIADFVDELEDLGLPKPGISQVISDVYGKSRNREIGGASGSIISEVFFKQTAKWETISRAFIAQAVAAVHDFITASFEAVCHSKNVADKLIKTLEDKMIRGYGDAFKQAKFILKAERLGDLQTLNRAYNTMYTELCAKNDEKIRYNENLHMEYNGLYVSAQPSHESTKATHTVRDIESRLESYYSVAVLRLMENIWNQAIEHFLIRSPDSPLFLFTQEWVMLLEPEKLAYITKEPFDIHEKRQNLEQKVKDLEKAVEIFRL